jgi:hypothetical protein
MGIVGVGISNDGSTVVAADFAGAASRVRQQRRRARGPRHLESAGAPSDFCHMVDTADGKTFAAGGASGHFYCFDVKRLIDRPAHRQLATGVEGAV